MVLKSEINITTMNQLVLYGWNDDLKNQKENSRFKEHIHGRVTLSHKTCYEVISEEGEFICELTGNMMYGMDPSEYPCTGDWVIFQPMDEQKGILLERMERKKTLYRLKSGTISTRQAIAAHVDKAFIVQSLDQNFNVRRLERFILQTSSEGIEPVIVFTKADLGFSRENVENAIRHLSPEIQVFLTSIQSPESIHALRDFISIGETVVFTGSSGVGKSTLINLLCRQEIMPVASISLSTGKGRHTTSRRELVLLEGSGALIDTPGVKLFGVTSDDENSLSEILDIDRFEGQCRFSDCRHINEKGCAVLKAIENGDLDRAVYESYLKLRKEAWHYTVSVHEKRKYEKGFSKMIKDFKKNMGYEKLD